MSPEIIAHRGFSARAPENTLAACRLALEHGADGLEFDLQTTLDGTPVVMHDERVDRTTDGSGPVRRFPLDQLRTLDAGSWYAPEFAGERVPTLDEVLTLAADHGARVYPEIKGYRVPEELARIVERLEYFGLLPTAVILAFDWRDLVRIREMRPDVAIGFEVDSAARLDYAIRAAARYGNAVLSCSTNVLAEPAALVAARAAGVPVVAWTVDDAALAARLAEAGVGGLITNDVGALAHLRGPYPLRD